MRITDQKGVSTFSGQRGARPAASTGTRFTIEQAVTSPKAEALAPAAILSSLDALIALQSGEGGRERRRRSLKRGHGMLDVLDELKIALLSGHLPAGMQQRLSVLLHESQPTGDPALDSIIDGIELRASVELAKLRVAASQREANS
jgi:hypothetical protein